MHPLPPPPTLVDRADGVAALASRVQSLQDAHPPTAPPLRVAIDTEFHSERRFRPALMLVQLGLPDGSSYVIDPLAAPLHALGPALARVELLVHGGMHDLALLHRATGTWPATVMDTQRAAGLVGAIYPARLEALLRQRVGLESPPSRAMSDWSVRPLRADQVRYAAADVQDLFPLAAELDAALLQAGRTEWARAACAELLEEARAPGWDPHAWRAWQIAPNLDEAERRVIQALMDWRMVEGRDRDQPPHFVLGDGLILQLARTRPAALEDLGRDRRMASGLRKRHGGTLLACITGALADAGPPPPPVPPGAPATAALLRAWAETVAEEEGIAAGLALPPELLQAVAEGGPSAVHGWRQAALGPALAALWEGRVSVTLSAGRPRRAPPLEPSAAPGYDSGGQEPT